VTTLAPASLDASLQQERLAECIRTCPSRDLPRQKVPQQRSAFGIRTYLARHHLQHSKSD
jgi:hypothetical protein